MKTATASKLEHRLLHTIQIYTRYPSSTKFEFEKNTIEKKTKRKQNLTGPCETKHVYIKYKHVEKIRLV